MALLITPNSPSTLLLVNESPVTSEAHVNVTSSTAVTPVAEW